MKLTLQTGLAIGAILLSSAGFAGNNGNFYAGVSIGAVSLMDNEHTNNPISDSHDLSATGINGGLLLGYDFILQNQYQLGVEGFANTTSVNIADNQNYAPVTSYTVNMRYNAGLRFLPAYAFTPGTLGHFIIGYSLAKFAINDNGNYGIVNSQFTKNGIQLGLGMMTALFNNASIRADVLYTAYSSQTSQGVTTTTPATAQNYHNSLSTLEGNLAFIYKFC
jgi:opacity protein-like surface antigen